MTTTPLLQPMQVIKDSEKSNNYINIIIITINNNNIAIYTHQPTMVATSPRVLEFPNRVGGWLWEEEEREEEGEAALGGGDNGERPELDWDLKSGMFTPTRGTLRVPISLADMCRCFTTCTPTHAHTHKAKLT